MVLTPEGVELRRGGSVVFCPWALFDAPGEPGRPGGGRGVRPGSPAAVPLARWDKAGRPVARGRGVRGRQLRFTGDREAVLGALYAVKSRDLAALLLHLGRALGGEPAEAR